MAKSNRSSSKNTRTGNRTRKGSSRKGKKASQKRTLKQRMFRWIAAFFLIMTLYGLGFLFLVYAGAFGAIPSALELEKVKNPIASEVYSADGKLLGRYYVENRSYVSFEGISKNVVDALIATEDARFYEHRGIDELALLRVLVKSIILQDRSAGGGSTLSQQLAKNLFGRQHYRFMSMPINKVREVIIAYRLESVFSKEEILTLYLNTVPFGENTYGIETASERFFNTTPDALDVPQAATLVGMLKANSAYNPRLHPEKSLKRRNVVIGQMVKYEYLTEEEGKSNQETPLGMEYKLLSHNTGLATYLREQVRQDLANWCINTPKEDGSQYNFYTDGLKIYTTIDSRLQAYAEQAMSNHMKALQGVFDKQWKSRDPWYKDPSVITSAMKRSDRYRKMKASGVSKKEIEKVFNTPVSMHLFSWNGDKDVEMTPMDSVRYYSRLLNLGMVVMDPRNGDVKCWIGGINSKYLQYDHVLSRRQVGSVFKPFVYLTALEQGVDPAEYISNERRVYSDYEDWSPKNSNGEYGGYYSMEGALAHSVNTIAVDVGMKAGIENVVSVGHDLGIESDLPEVPSVALGVANLSLKEMVTAYCGIVNDGVPVNPGYLVRIEDQEGNILTQFPRVQPRGHVVSQENTRILLHMMEAVVDSGTARSLRHVYGLPGPIAGKTGTTQNNADGWFIGCTPKLVSGVWVGAEDPRVHFRTTYWGQGARMALPIWAGFMKRVGKDQEWKKVRWGQFPQPNDGILASLEEPHFRENLMDSKVEEFFHDLFGRKKKDAEVHKEREETLQESKKEPAKEKKGWGLKRLRDLFKKSN